MKNFVPKGKLLKLNISLFLMKEINVHTRVNIHRLRKRGSEGAGGVREVFLGEIVWFLGEMEGDQSSPTELKRGPYKTLTANERDQ